MRSGLRLRFSLSAPRFLGADTLFSASVPESTFTAKWAKSVVINASVEVDVTDILLELKIFRRWHYNSVNAEKKATYTNVWPYLWSTAEVFPAIAKLTICYVMLPLGDSDCGTQFQYIEQNCMCWAKPTNTTASRLLDAHFDWRSKNSPWWVTERLNEILV